MMAQLLVRFGLPWLIFAAAAYALYWAMTDDEYLAPVRVGTRVLQTPPPVERQAGTAGQAGDGAGSPRWAAMPEAASVKAHEAHGFSPPVVPARVEAHAGSRSRAITSRATADIPAQERATTAVRQSGLQATTLALQSSSPRTRHRALARSLEQELSVPLHLLQHMASSDSDREVRVLAMSAFAHSPQADPAVARTIVQSALADPEESIRTHAKDILEELDLAARPNEEAPQLSQSDTAVQ